MATSELCVTNLSYQYRPGGGEIISDLTHAFEPGAVTAITGASGRGKSTLLYLLGLMLTPQRGVVELRGQRVDNLADSSRSRLRARHISFVFQDAVLDPTRSALENVREPILYVGLPARAVEAESLALLQSLGVGPRAGHRPGEMSGGQAQRVACLLYTSDAADE